MNHEENCKLAIEMFKVIKQRIQENPETPVQAIKDSFLMDKAHWLNGCPLCNEFFDVAGGICSRDCPLTTYVSRIPRDKSCCACPNTPYYILANTGADMRNRLLAADRIIQALEQSSNEIYTLNDINTECKELFGDEDTLKEEF